MDSTSSVTPQGGDSGGTDELQPVMPENNENQWRSYAERTFLFQFSDDEGRDRMLDEGPWIFAQFPMVLKPWTPEARLDKRGEEKYQYGSVFPSLVCNFGMRKCSVRLAAFWPMRSLVNENGKEFIQKVECEWKPPLCSHCRLFGHNVKYYRFGSAPKEIVCVMNKGFRQQRSKKEWRSKIAEDEVPLLVMLPEVHVEVPPQEESDSIVDIIVIQEVATPSVDMQVANSFAILDGNEKVEASVEQGSGNNSNHLKCKGSELSKEACSINTQQHVFECVRGIGNGAEFMMSVVYGSNCKKERKMLWKSLKDAICLVGREAWIAGGTITLNWIDHGMLRVLDRILCNHQWFDKFRAAMVDVLVASESDHCSLNITVMPEITQEPKPFKYQQFWSKHSSLMALSKNVGRKR
ncbi:hypothetical protein LIER_21236 [Lithospermum erythrorhizon]|uniref:DUF4283 domain-containing protein n=1 Tax=Lithospermum erythrorhizon TaxID=34254 RepID=A0AAV3QS00_LITER